MSRIIKNITVCCILHIFFFLKIFNAVPLLTAQISDSKTRIAEAMVTRAMEDTLGYHLLRELTLLGHRLPGSENAARAVRWAKKKMEECELDSVWLQSCPVPHWERGKTEEAILLDSGGYKLHSLFQRLGIQPKRTIRTIFYMNEEMGLSGAETYSKWFAESGETHIAAIESDRGVHTPRGFFIDSDSVDLSTIQSWLPLLKRACIEWIRKGGSGADVGRIHDSRVLIGYVPDIQRYFDFHHSANDVFRSVHPREMELGTAAMAVLVYMLSENF